MTMATTLTLPVGTGRPALGAKLRAYWTMIKSLQSGLLLITAVAGYVSGCCLNLTAGSMSAMMGSMWLAVTGSTVFNMIIDRDIDALMNRTVGRPLPAGTVSLTEAAVLASLLSLAGIGWAYWLAPLYGLLVAAGLLLDVVVYSVLLKRRTPFSILIGGISGGMPILAGRALATGTIDGVGLLFALGVLLWIPLHILTFAISEADDYARAGIPTIPARYGLTATRWLISTTIVAATMAMLAAAWQLALPVSVHLVLAGCAAVLALLTLVSLFWPRPIIEFVLYKGASVYMLATMLTVIGFGL